MEHKKDAVSKKDLYYSIGFLVIAVILSLTWRGGNNIEIVNQISLASSLTSIVLALVAIIYAFLQTSESSRQNQQVQQALDKISDKVNEFGEIKNQISLLREDSKSNSENLLQQIDSYLVQRMESINESVFKALQEQKVNIPEEVKKAISQKYTDNINVAVDDIKEKLKVIADLEEAIARIVTENIGPGELLTYERVGNYLNHTNIPWTNRDLGFVFMRLANKGLLKQTKINGFDLFTKPISEK